MALLPEHSALQHQRAPRPLPLFLELLREVSRSDPELARGALAGLKAYENAPRVQRTAAKPEAARIGGACLRDHGGTGPPVVLVPSLINPPSVLDLDREVSLTAAIANMGRRTFLLDWGEVSGRSALTVSGHVENLLLPLLGELGERAILIGYCLGGTMVIAAANLVPCEAVSTLASPWNFNRYPSPSRQALRDMWRHSEPAAQSLGALPMEVLQAAFWSLDPQRTVRKFAQFGRLDPTSAEAQRFVALEDWANEGEPLPYPAAKELIEDLFDHDLSGSGQWRVGGTTVTDDLPVRALHLTAERDLIAPSATAPGGTAVGISSGHVGMIVGSARSSVHAQLRDFLAPCR
jgi:poly[(R)-3-hydroxyalkanoate] polymerase subunit PhaC